MVRLTVDLIARCTSGYSKKKRDESIQQYLKRLTHLYLENRNIDEIGEDLSMCRHLTVLYLYDNKLTRVPNLNHNGQLTHVYLQNNQIEKLEHLGTLPKLTKLYIGGNSITVVEGLEKLSNLQELHIENQKLPAGEKLLFDPRSISSLAKSLQVLNVSGNHIDSLRELQQLYHLCQFMASDNQLADMKELADCLSSWRHLWRLDLTANPLCHRSKYRDKLIVLAPSLEMLDGKEVTETAKQFLKNWQASKDLIQRRRESSLMQENADQDNAVGQGVGSGMAKHRSAPGYLMPGLPKKQFQQVLARSASIPPAPAGDAPVLHRMHSTGAPKHFNQYSAAAPSAPPTRPAFVNLGADYALGDGMPHVGT